MERRIENRQLVNIFVLFLIVQFGGLLFAFYTIPPYLLSQLAPSTLSSGQSADFVIYIIFVLIAASFILIFLMRRLRGNLFFRGLEAYAVGLPTAFLVFYLLGAIIPGLNPIYAAVFAFAAAALLVLAKNRWPKLRNTATVIASIGIGVVIGFSGFYLAYILLLVVAVYDYASVFITKHMQVMARGMAERNMAMLIGSSDVEMLPGTYMSEADRKAIASSVKKQKDVPAAIKRMMKEGAYPTVSQVMLGGGDLAMPLVLVVGTYVSVGNLFVPMLLILGAQFGLMLTMAILQRYKVPLPAIPPLFASMNLFLGIGLFATGHVSWAGLTLYTLIFLGIMSVLILTLERNRGAGQ